MHPFAVFQLVSLVEGKLETKWDIYIEHFCFLEIDVCFVPQGASVSGIALAEAAERGLSPARSAGSSFHKALPCIPGTLT